MVKHWVVYLENHWAELWVLLMELMTAVLSGQRMADLMVYGKVLRMVVTMETK